MPRSLESLGSRARNQRNQLNSSGRKGRKSVRILLAESQPMIRHGLRALLEAEWGFRVVGEAGSGEETLAQLSRSEPDILLLDLAIPPAGGIDVLRQLAASALPVRVLVLTGDIGASETAQALNLGARGLVSKSSPGAMLFEGIQRVMAGGYWVSPESIASLVERLRHTPPRITPQKTQYGLTARELEVIMEVVTGSSNPEIAEKLLLSEQTVKHHLTHIFDKLGVYSRVELAMFATNHNLCSAGEPV